MADPDDPDDDEVSPSGHPIYRHRDQAEFEPAFGDEDAIREVGDHIEAHLGRASWVFHELLSDKVHLDVHMVEPTAERPFHTLVTSGMSERPMTLPDGVEAREYAELCISLPADWDLRQEAFEDENVYWPVRWLKTLARLPHDYRTWLGFGHTVPNGDPPEPFADRTEFCGMLVLPPVHLPRGFRYLRTAAGKEVEFFTLIPLYPEEMDFKLTEGTRALLDLFNEFDVTPVVAPGRVNVCRER